MNMIADVEGTNSVEKETTTRTPIDDPCLIRTTEVGTIAADADPLPIAGEVEGIETSTALRREIITKEIEKCLAEVAVHL